MGRTPNIHICWCVCRLSREGYTDNLVALVDFGDETERLEDKYGRRFFFVWFFFLPCVAFELLNIFKHYRTVI